MNEMRDKETKEKAEKRGHNKDHSKNNFILAVAI